MSVTANDIGTTAIDAERNLGSIFRTAISWGAVLLIDVISFTYSFSMHRIAHYSRKLMCSWSAENPLIYRGIAWWLVGVSFAPSINSSILFSAPTIIVSILLDQTHPTEKLTEFLAFLRALEYYDGILFLTTNRVGASDDAFASRVHVQLYYRELNEEQRQQVWQTFINKLARERGDYIRVNIDAKEYIRGSQVRAVKWNGREIRNGEYHPLFSPQFNLLDRF